MAKLFAAASSQYMTVNSAPVTAAPFSVSCWFRPTAIGATLTPFGIGQIGVTNENWRLTVNAIGRARWSAQTSAGEVFATYSTTTFSAGVWGHIGGVEASATSHTVYFNGGSSTNTTSRAPASVDTTRIGLNARSGGADYADGDIAEVGIWNIDLTAAEMTLLAAGYSPLFVRPESLVFYMPLVRNDVELSGGLALTPVNSPTVSDHPRILLPSRPYYSLPAAAGGGAYTLTADVGAYTLTGQNAGLLFGRLITAASGSYTLTGYDATLSYNGLTHYTLTADTGAYTLTGQAAGLLVARLLTASPGAFAYTGNDAGLLFGRLLSAANGSYTVSGQTAGLILAWLLTAANGSYALTGQNVTLIYSGDDNSTPTDADRIFVIESEGRVFIVATDSRRLAIEAESRRFEV